MKKSSQEKEKKEKEMESPTGKPTTTQDTGPKNQVNEILRGDDFSDDETHLEGDELREDAAEQKGQSGREEQKED